MPVINENMSIKVDGEYFEADENNFVYIDGYRVDSVEELEQVVGALIRAVISIVK